MNVDSIACLELPNNLQVPWGLFAGTRLFVSIDKGAWSTVHGIYSSKQAKPLIPEFNVGMCVKTVAFLFFPAGVPIFNIKCGGAGGVSMVGRINSTYRLNPLILFLNYLYSDQGYRQTHTHTHATT